MVVSRRTGPVLLFFPLFFSLFLGVTALSAQDAEDALARPRYMLYLFETEEGSMSEREEFILYNSILSATAAASDAVVLLESPDPDVPRTQAGREGLARSANADSWLHVIASGGLENLTVEVETFDLLRRQTIGRQIIRPGFVVDYRILAVGLWGDIEETLRTEYERIIDRTTLTIAARPGTEITGLPGGPREVGTSGSIDLSVPSSSAYTITAELRGFYQVRRPLFVGIDPMTVEFDQVEQPQFGIDLRISSLQFPGFRFWYYPIPARVFARAGFTTQAIGFFPIDNTEELFRSGSSLSFFAIDGGVYLTPPEEFFRFFIGGGGYIRFVHPSLGEIALERDAAPGALTLVLGGEYSTSRRLRFFFEYQPAYIFADDPDRFIDVTFVRNRYPDGEVPGFVTMSNGLCDFRNVYFGARWDF